MKLCFTAPLVLMVTDTALTSFGAFMSVVIASMIALFFSAHAPTTPEAPTHASAPSTTPPPKTFTRVRESIDESLARGHARPR
jgi:hypothetical protein